MGLWSRKSIAALQQEAAEEGEGGLRRTLSATNLTLLGIGAIIGAGIFVLTGTAAAHTRARALCSRSCWPASAASSPGSATPSSRR